jgi:hypothetical protein
MMITADVRVGRDWALRNAQRYTYRIDPDRKLPMAPPQMPQSGVAAVRDLDRDIVTHDNLRICRVAPSRI